MTRSRVFTERSRSDQNREIESLGDNVSTRSHTQPGKETEISELMQWLLRERAEECFSAMA